jgi:hypothetical protein
MVKDNNGDKDKDKTKTGACVVISRPDRHIHCVVLIFGCLIFVILSDVVVFGVVLNIVVLCCVVLCCVVSSFRLSKTKHLVLFFRSSETNTKTKK